MYQFSIRLAAHAITSSLEYNIDLLDIASHQARALLASINALSLVEPDDAWIAVSAGHTSNRLRDEFAMNDEEMAGPGMCLLLTPPLEEPESMPSAKLLYLLDLKREYSLALAKLEISRHLPELQDSYSILNPAECVSLYSKCGLYEAACGMCKLFSLDFSAVFISLAGNVASSTHGSGDRGTKSSWDMVKEYLALYDGQETGFKYHAVFLEALFKIDCNISLPRCILLSFKVSTNVFLTFSGK